MKSKAEEAPEILKELEKIYADNATELKVADSKAKVENIRIQALGLKSRLNSILKNLKKLPLDSRKNVGKKANSIKHQLEEMVNTRYLEVADKDLKNRESNEKIDVTLPGKRRPVGHKHILTQMQHHAEDIFQKMGFEIYYPYILDDDYHHFESLNIPQNHPARDSWDTFWSENNYIAIAHTSSMQNRILSANTPPIKAIVPGRCFRNEATDARHEHTFNQIEGIYVDKGVTLGDMLGTLKEFFTKFFDQEIEVQFTPDYSVW
jgi:phenylalanyl-tRNA synthetase alpha chain